MRDRRGGAIVLWPFLPRNSVFGLDQREGIGSAHFALPAGDIAIGFTTVLLELEQAHHEIAQGGHDVGAGQAGDVVAVFLLLLDHLAFAQIVAVAPNGDELPAPA